MCRGAKLDSRGWKTCRVLHKLQFVFGFHIHRERDDEARVLCHFGKSTQGYLIVVALSIGVAKAVSGPTTRRVGHLQIRSLRETYLQVFDQRHKRLRL